ncbi:MAG: TRAP transporter large permease subunit, partial [candidate division WOR-3 bacterium]
TLPVIFPLVTSLGYDPYAFLIILILMQGIAFITPPIGMQVFVVSALAKENAAVVFKGVTPFFLAQVTAVWILVFVPRLVTWLPDILYGTS